MDIRSLARVDLNLLVALQVMLEERSVTRAAERLFITQPAMSKTLARLRDVFDDPLFTRSAHGMRPTPRALSLHHELQAVLLEIRELIATKTFDPATHEGEIVLAISEYVGMALLPALLQRLQGQAPRLNVRTITRLENQLDQLALGALDFVFQIAQDHYAPEFHVEYVGSSPPVLLLREGHPLTQGRASFARISQFPLLRLYIPDFERIDLFRHSEAFAHLRRANHGVFETSHLLTALEVLRATDYVLSGPAFVLRNPGVTLGITSVPLPEDATFTLNYLLVSHERTARSPLHIWFKAQMLEALDDLRRADTA